MNLINLSLRNFRNYEELSLKLSPGTHIFLGENGSGKTNLIEALEIISTCRSHRTRNDADIIKTNADNAIVEVEYERYGVKQTARVTLQRKRGRDMKIGARKITFSELIGNIKTVLFSPDDLMLAKGSPALRRAFIDREICQADKVYLNRLMRYNGILKERNALLKLLKEGEAKMDMLEIYDIQFAKEASFIVSKRTETIKELSKVASQTMKEISNDKENLEIVYDQGYNEITLEKDFLKMLEANFNKDVKRGYTSIGPHVDDLTFKMNSMRLKNYASQGQQRTAVLATKLAEVSFLKEQTDEYPALLLDDVFSELDADRRKKLLDFVKNKQINAFLTATDDSYIPKDMGIRHIVKDGKII